MKRFAIILLIRHPNIDPAEISEVLGLQPHSSWKAGDNRFTPVGRPLQGTRQLTSWNYVKEWEGDYSFPKDLEKFVLQLVRHRSFFLRLAGEGARSEVYVQLPGDINQGGSIRPQVLTQIAELGFYFGIEVFPNWRSSQFE